MSTMTAKQVNNDLVALLRAKVTLFVIKSFEELRVERNLLEVATSARFELWTWDCWRGLKAPGNDKADDSYRDPSRVFSWIADSDKRAIIVMRDVHRWFDPSCIRALRTLQRELQAVPANKAKAIILLSPLDAEFPPDLRCATTIEYPLPDRDELSSMLQTMVDNLPDGLRETATQANGKSAAVDAALGLQIEEAATCYAKSIVTNRKIEVREIASEKRRVIAREKVITWYEPDPRGLDAVGGNGNVKGWLKPRQSAFSEAARKYGLPAPKGILLVGVPGCGKSLIAKAVATAWKMPLLRLDIGALRSKYVGESEGNLRRALKVAETVSPCVLWIDEIEKAMAGSTGPQGDGGVAADALGAILSWMQEREGQVFVVATANDVRSLPPELLRKGRFDEMFFVDLPTHDERVEIWTASLRERKVAVDKIDLALLAKKSDLFTGAEIAACVPEAMFVAFSDAERPVTTQDLLGAVATVVPLAKTASEKIDNLREWAATRARPATSRESSKVSTKSNASARQLEVE